MKFAFVPVLGLQIGSLVEVSRVDTVNGTLTSANEFEDNYSLAGA